MAWFIKKSGYVSEFTQFLGEMKQKNPAIEEGQRAGRGRLWDKEPIDLDNMRRSQESRVHQSAYVYQGH